MNNTDSPTNKSPLDQVHLIEEEVALDISHAKMQSDEIIKTAQEEASRILARAQESYQQAVQKQYQSIISQAKQDAQKQIEQAQQKANRMRSTNTKQIEAAVDFAVSLIINAVEAGEKS